jgi:hypothetical protein
MALSVGVRSGPVETGVNERWWHGWGGRPGNLGAVRSTLTVG